MAAQSYGDATAWQNVTGTAPVPVQAALTGLAGDTTYHYRIVVMAGTETLYGDDMAFTTTPCATARRHRHPGQHPCSRRRNHLHGDSDRRRQPERDLIRTVHFEYGPTTLYGSVTDPNQNIPAGTDVVDVHAEITGLTPLAFYHCRIVATSDAGHHLRRGRALPSKHRRRRRHR